MFSPRAARRFPGPLCVSHTSRSRWYNLPMSHSGQQRARSPALFLLLSPSHKIPCRDGVKVVVNDRRHTALRIPFSIFPAVLGAALASEAPSMPNASLARRLRHNSSNGGKFTSAANLGKSTRSGLISHDHRSQNIYILQGGFGTCSNN